MIEINKENVKFKGDRIQLSTELTIAMIAFIETEPLGINAGFGILRDCLRVAAKHAGNSGGSMIDRSSLDKALGMIQETEAEQ